MFNSVLLQAVKRTFCFFISKQCIFSFSPRYNQSSGQITEEAAQLFDQVYFSREQIRGGWGPVGSPPHYLTLSPPPPALFFFPPGRPLFISGRLDFKQIQRSSSKMPNREPYTWMPSVSRARGAGTAAALPQCPATVLHLCPGRPTSQDKRIIHSL